MAAQTRWQDLYPDPDPVEFQQAQQISEWQRALQVVPSGYSPVPEATTEFAIGPDPIGLDPIGQDPTGQYATAVLQTPEELDVVGVSGADQYAAAATEYAPRATSAGPRCEGGSWVHGTGPWNTATSRVAGCGGRLRAMDGLVTNASLIGGVGGGGAANHTIILTGLAGLIAGAFSMATGEYISVCSQNELTEAEVAVEQLQHWRNPQGEEKELAAVFVARGVAPDVAEIVAQQISVDPREAVKVHIREELGIDPDDLPSPWTAAGASFASFTVGALLPLLPYLFGIPAAFALALVLAGVASFAGGAAVAQLTGRPPLQGGLRQFGLGTLATGMTFLVGLLVGAHVA